MSEPSEFSEPTLLLMEIHRVAEEARAKQSTLCPGQHAARLFARYPDAHFSIRRITDELVLAASKLGVTVEITRPD